MNVQPITDSNTQVKWVNPRNKNEKSGKSTVINEEKAQAYIPDFTSPDDELRMANASQKKVQKADKKSRPFLYTSENWIG